MVDALYAAARALRAGDAEAARRVLSPPLFPAGGEATLARLAALRRCRGRGSPALSPRAR